MFSYRHAFHAGNHADVLKHVVLIQVLLYTCQKETPFFYIDTHAGGGIYSLRGHEAKKRAEFQSGIGKLWKEKAAPKPVEDYLRLIRSMNPDGALNVYPGSPCIADIILRHHDKLRLFELHPSEIQILERNILQLAEKNRLKDIHCRFVEKERLLKKKTDFRH